jgi:hypothetical protein
VVHLGVWCLGHSGTAKPEDCRGQGIAPRRLDPSKQDGGKGVMQSKANLKGGGLMAVG